MAVKILVVYYSSYGHIEKMAEAIAEGVKEVSGVEVVVKRVEELLPLEVCKKNGYKLDQPAPIADPKELPKYDGIIFGTPTRFGNMAAQMKNFLDRTGGLWMEGKLVGSLLLSRGVLILFTDWKNCKCLHIERHTTRWSRGDPADVLCPPAASGHDHHWIASFI